MELEKMTKVELIDKIERLILDKAQLKEQTNNTLREYHQSTERYNHIVNSLNKIKTSVETIRHMRYNDLICHNDSIKLNDESSLVEAQDLRFLDRIIEFAS